MPCRYDSCPTVFHTSTTPLPFLPNPPTTIRESQAAMMLTFSKFLVDILQPFAAANFPFESRDVEYSAKTPRREHVRKRSGCVNALRMSCQMVSTSTTVLH